LITKKKKEKEKKVGPVGRVPHIKSGRSDFRIDVGGKGEKRTRKEGTPK